MPFIKKSQPENTTPPTENISQLRAEFWHQLWKTITLLFIAVVVIAAASVAWFVSNTRVNSATAPVSAGFEPIKLATKGQRQTAESTLLNLGEGTIFLYGEDTYYFAEDGTIALRLDSNNVSVRPGSSGEVTIYIIPKHTGTLETTLYLELAGYQKYTENAVTTARPVENPVLDTLLDGHILLFRDKDYSHRLWTESGNILHISKDAREGVPLPVTFYWYWPLRYEDMKEAWLDRTLNNPLPETSDYRYNRVFIAKADVLTDAKLCDEAYNRADEYIGSHADFLYLSIQTSLTEEPTT